jgi:hypothetical protein
MIPAFHRAPADLKVTLSYGIKRVLSKTEGEASAEPILLP